MKENEIVNIFISHIEQFGFNVWPEYGDWDLVIERNGHVIGVEAKTERNLHLLAQLCQKDNVHFKVALIPYFFDSRESDWILIARRLKIIPVLINLKHSDHAVQIYYGVKNLFYYRNRPKKLIKLPDFKYNTPAGVPSPRKVNLYNIALCRLELLALQQNEYVSLLNMRALGIRIPPRQYYDYDWERRSWRLKPPFFRASRDYPHIWSGLNGDKK